MQIEKLFKVHDKAYPLRILARLPVGALQCNDEQCSRWHVPITFCYLRTLHFDHPWYSTRHVFYPSDVFSYCPQPPSSGSLA